MRHILSVQNDDGTFPEVGTVDRWCRVGISRAYALRLARETYQNKRRPVRVESWADSEFYKPNSRPLVTIVGSRP